MMRKLLTFMVVLLCVGAVPAIAGILVENADSYMLNGVQATSYTSGDHANGIGFTTFDMSGGTKLVVTAAGEGNGGPSSIISVSYAGEELTQVIHAASTGANAGFQFVSIWYLDNPVESSGTITVTTSSNANGTGIGAVSLSGVALGDALTAVGGDGQSVDINTANNSVSVAAYVSQGAGLRTTNAPLTEFLNGDVGSAAGMSGYELVTTGVVGQTYSFVGSTTRPVTVAANFAETSRGAAHTPTPDGIVEVAKDDVSPLTWISGQYPDGLAQPADPNILDVTGYTVFFGTDPNIIENPATDVTTESLEVTVDDDATYYWCVDSTVVWDSNDFTGTASTISVVEGPVWTFTTLPENPAPVVDAGDDVLTALTLMPASLAGTVTDTDIVSADWSVVGLPGEPSDSVVRMIDRMGVHLENVADAEPNLLRNWAGCYNSAPRLMPMKITISGVQAGSHAWTSYHHDPENQHGTFNMTLKDADGDEIIEQTMTNGLLNSLAEAARVTTTVVSDGSDIVVIMEMLTEGGQLDFLGINGFELGDLKINFVDDAVHVHQDYQPYIAVNKNLASFTAQTFSAFGGTDNVTVDVDFGLPNAGLLQTSLVPGGTLALPTALFTTNFSGDYTIRLQATDTGQSVADTMVVTVADDACKAAQLSTAWAGFNDYDFNSDCKVDIDDLAAMAAEWLDNREITSQQLM